MPKTKTPDSIALASLAREDVRKGVSGLISYLLDIGADPTDDDVWRRAKRTYLRALLEAVQAEING